MVTAISRKKLWGFYPRHTIRLARVGATCFSRETVPAFPYDPDRNLFDEY